MKINLYNCEGQNRLFFRDMYEAKNVFDYLEHVWYNQARFHPANVFVAYGGHEYRYMDHYNSGADKDTILKDLLDMEPERILIPSDNVTFDVDMYEHRITIRID